jgi:DNA-binding transcriptional LysR family regulator
LVELRHLRYFEAVATALSFRHAAERLHVVQPALSRQIKDLEYELRVRLLDRDTTGVRLTDAGRVFLEEVRQILAHAERAAEMAREAAVGRRGRLLVGNVGPITASFMPACLTEFRARYPDVAVTLKEIEPAEQISAVDAGIIEVGFTVEKTPVLPAYLCHRAILRSAMSAVVGAGHRLAGAARVSLEELAREKLLCFAGQRAQTHAELLRGIFAAHGLKCRAIAVVAGFESLLAMIAGGQGVSLMPQHITVSGADRIEIIPLHETADDLVFEVSAVWRRNDTALLARNFVEVLDEFNKRTRPASALTKPRAKPGRRAKRPSPAGNHRPPGR